ncbi:Fe II, 2-oxoglutarate-dependent dioxygenase [Hyphopichia burtonii NRRL Y-1933]|uniref:uS12 prolyl 3,4-dihydroxylase n=1 Tax=Hyphopichia burtonii NRRL Y-1933 TaxID=984485 RepID=A0A1E4RC43_9ASCO|nr:Fe II, 2-oxoglutarate-dependent dioxygenase [Hyphopichia burtonii NRRL Y-1933]ODV64820.1 Fe II, 2-oxoglutarate-dependent dioxygenase [Hyphopichia burtonii NRRL Y-1933]
MPTSKRSTEESGPEEPKKLDTQYKHEDIKRFFNQQIWDDNFQNRIQGEVADSQPYRWGTITELMDDTLLRQVRKEVLNEIAFTKKETDIYKVYQSGDLANLSGLNWDDLSRLPSLYKLRAAIYSEEFRDVISKITGCGKLSGVKTDMSINTYTKGCHLLTHDDVIGSRRVSFILYLPDPNKKWKSHYGGGLRLFPAIVPNVPKTDFDVKLVPQFNQIAFFTVQPGLSFHDVEEVRVDKQRLSIQGWFHIPQPGENGYIPGEQEETESRSTLQQLQSKELQEFDFPKPTRIDFPVEELKIYEQDFKNDSTFSKYDIEYLSKYINPLYLNGANLKQLNEMFMNESVVEINDIIKPEYANLLKESIIKHELEEKVPSNSKEVKAPWKTAIPPHKQRYLYMDGKSSFEPTESMIKHINHVGTQELPNFNLLKNTTNETTDQLLLELNSFMKSISFKKWLILITSLIPTSDQIITRRFRPGHDFILATTTDKNLARDGKDELNVLLEATLNLTPTAQDPKNWESGEFGGYELCMALNKDEDDDDFEDDDPAVYKASSADDDSVLYTSQCKWNSLCLMLRDPLVLKFVKYVSINAKGSRWDVSAQWNVKSFDDEVDEDENNDN